MNNATYTPPSEQTLGEYLDAWLASSRLVTRRGRPMAPTTEAVYRYTLKRITDRIGSVTVGKLGVADVQRVRDELLAEGLRPKSVADTLALLRQALRRAVREGRLRVNPADTDLVNRPQTLEETGGPS